ncbi:hypothetical protein TNCV_2868271 [Trichonephila clavipes]|nr:hypothetical protein TNCV_2868271 [Trichonephila clavipes]
MHRVCQQIVPGMLNEDQSADQVKIESQAEVKDMAENRFQKCFENLYKRWQKCVVTLGSYFEGGCISAVKLLRQQTKLPHLWSEANPQVYVETPLHPEKLTDWCALWAGGIRTSSKTMKATTLQSMVIGIEP